MQNLRFPVVDSAAVVLKAGLRQRCHLCPTVHDRKVVTVSSNCKKACCRHHRKIICRSCLESSHEGKRKMMRKKSKRLEERPFRVAFVRATCGVLLLFSLLSFVEFLLMYGRKTGLGSTRTPVGKLRVKRLLWLYIFSHSL